ncbi:MAG: glycosyltransferase family 4 protein, partial [Candidatus Sericytochromatia bacterium]
VHVYSHLYQPVPGAIHHPVSAPIGINLFRVFGFFAASSAALRGERYDIVHAIGGCTARQDVVTAQFCQRAWGEQLKHQSAGSPAGGLAARARRLYHEIYWRTTDMLEARAFKTGPGRRLIAVSKGVREELARYYGADASQVAVVYNGVEPAEFSAEAIARHRDTVRAELGFGPDERVLLFVGDFYRKGLGTVIRALGAMKAERVKLLVVGRGEIEAFKAMAAEAGVADQLTFVGFQPQVVPYFAAADAFVFPTRGEGWGYPVMEALACGLPVIATNWSALTDFFHEGIGYPVESKLIPAVARCPYYEGFNWAETDEMHLRAQMRHVYENHQAAKAKGLLAAAEMQAKYALSVTGLRMRDRLAALGAPVSAR